MLQYFATGLEPWWWAAWLAPIPLLLAAFRASRREAWALAIVAGLIGSASTAGYYGLFIGPIVNEYTSKLWPSLVPLMVANGVCQLIEPPSSASPARALNRR